jgi:polyhydroxyalkanoate synthesis regulator phasin
MQNPTLENLLQTMREAVEKLERAVQLPSRKDFDAMTDKVDELSKRIASIEKTGRKPGAAKKPRKK